MKWIALPLLFAVLVLTGCASTRLVDSDVTTFSRLATLPATPTYSFERLPSQQAQGAAQAALEAQAQHALSKVGLRPDSKAPFYRVQVHARTNLQPPPDGWYDPWWGWGMGHGFHGGIALRVPPPPMYHREVELILRESASGNVVYETQAVHEGLWNDAPAVFAAMFDAALSGFPFPPAGRRRVNVGIPR